MNHADPPQVEDDPRATLHAAWLQARPALVRFLTVRCGSVAAAEDVIQDVWIRLEGMSAEAAADVRQPQAFLYRLAANLALDRAKAERRAGARDLEWRRTQVAADDTDASNAPAADDAAWARQKLARVVAVINQLPPKAAEAFRLHKFDGLTQTEVAARMGMSRSAVEKYVAGALKDLLQKVGWP